MAEVVSYILDKNFQTVAVIDTYESFLWVERYNSCGDFEIYTYPDDNMIQYAVKNNYIWKSDSDYIMVIEELEILSYADSGAKFIIKGRSLESILDRRIIWPLTRLRTNIQAAIKHLIVKAIINPEVPARKISNFVFKDTTDSFITTTQIDRQFTGDNLLDAIIEICSYYAIGFRITLNENRQFVFELFRGKDHSYAQTSNPYIVFSSKYGNLVNSDYFESIQQYKNVTVVAGEGEDDDRRYRIVGTTAGLDRRELYTDARDLSSSLENNNLIANMSFSPVTKNGLTIAYEGEGKVSIKGTPTTNNFTITANLYTIASIARAYYRISGCPGDEESKYTFALSVSGIGTSTNGVDYERVISSPLSNLVVSITMTIPNNESMITYSAFHGQNFEVGETYYELVGQRYALTTDTVFNENKMYFTRSLEDEYTRFTGSSFQQGVVYYELKSVSYRQTNDAIVDPKKLYFTKRLYPVYEEFTGTSFTQGTTYYVFRNGEYVPTEDWAVNPNVKYYTRRYEETYDRFYGSVFSDDIEYYEISNYNYDPTNDGVLVNGKTYYTKGYREVYSVYSGRNFDVGVKYYELIGAHYIQSSDISVNKDKKYYTKKFENININFNPKVERYAIHDLDYYELLDKRGLEKLTENELLEYFDGEVDPSLFTYKKDYSMGDIVQIENEFKMSGKARIIEFISSFGSNGIKNYPTFQIIPEEV